MGDVIPPSRLVRFRVRRSTSHFLPALAVVCAQAVHLRRSLLSIEDGLKRVKAQWRRATDRHDAYEALLAHCLSAAAETDPVLMDRLREDILRDHAALLHASSTTTSPLSLKATANDDLEVPQ